MNRKRFTAALYATLALVTVLVTGACGNMPPVQLPNPIQIGTPLPTATPTLTPSPTPPPTPTPLPGDVVNLGERELRNGDWDAAAYAFQLVVDNTAATIDERVDAYLGLAQASLRRGDFAAAQATLDALLTQYADHPRAAQAYFLRGDARMGLSNWAGAIEDYNQYLALRPGMIDSYVFERIADAYLAQEATDEAVAAYDQALAADRNVVAHLQLREKVASIHRTLGNYDAAIAQYQAVLAAAQNASYRATIDFYIAQVYLEAGNTDAYFQQLDHVFMTYPETYEGFSALVALREAELPVDQYQRGIANFTQEQYDIALEAFYNYLAQTPIGDYRPETFLYIARSYRRLDAPENAISELLGMIARFGPEDGDAWGEAWLELADSYAQAGDSATALTTYETFVSENPTLPQAPTALYNASGIASATGDLARASAYLDRLAAEYPQDARASEGMFNLGIDAYRAGDHPTAATLFSTAAARAANQRPAASHFWLGKTLQVQGQTEEAAAALNAALAAESGSYYGLRAQDLLIGAPAFESDGAEFAIPEDLDEGRLEAEQWLGQRFGLTETPPLAQTLRADLATDPRMLRGLELWQLGLSVEARDSFEAVRRDHQEEPLALYQLAIYFRDIGLYRSSLLSAARIITLADSNPLEVPAFLARLRYPVYFTDLVLIYTAQYDLDPFWVYSLIYQESQFEGFAVSSASAQGLMQIWPPTGEDIAQRLAWPGYQPSDLQRPMVSVAFGTWLLRVELNRFDQNPYAALTAYNAGPGNTADWVELSMGDPDLFVEVISLQEPRTYVQRIIEHYHVYRALYSAGPEPSTP